ncbi:tRNA methyltransferase 1 [Rhizophlyctis rosea]|nr:tRNA methyltransferase 1 [Rhizophlyctis rosea]
MADKSEKKKKRVDHREATPSFKSREEHGRVFVTEGQACISFPSNAVFYNPVQEFNRDLSVAAINTWSKIFLTERVRGKPNRTERQLARKVERAASDDDVKADSVKEKTDSPSVKSMEVDTTNSTPLDPSATASSNKELSKPARRKEKRANFDFEAAASPLRWLDTLEEIKLDDPAEQDDTPDLKNHKFNVLEALAASGLRSIRYAKELDHVGNIVANDLLPTAVDAIERNAKDNGVEDRVTPTVGDASFAMYQALSSNKRYDVIDLDPYGSAAPFLDGAVQAVSEGGLLCITCTDLAVLAGSQPEACWAKYGGMPIPNAPYCHELALRILLHTLSTTAARYKRYIAPLASFSIDFYVRVFVRVYTSAAQVKAAAGKSGLVYSCIGCKTFETQQIGKTYDLDGLGKGGPVTGPVVNQACQHCGKRSHTGGPFWAAPIHDRQFLAQMLRHIKAEPKKYGTSPRMQGMLTVAFEELPIPLYYTLPALTGVVHSNTPPMSGICSAILHLGFKVSISHAMAGSIKTNAPSTVMWDIMRKWVEENPVKRQLPNAPGTIILQKPRTLDISFTKHPNADPPSRKIKLVRFQENPTRNWGPMAKAGTKSAAKNNSSKPKAEAPSSGPANGADAPTSSKRKPEDMATAGDDADGTDAKKPKLQESGPSN